MVRVRGLECSVPTYSSVFWYIYIYIYIVWYLLTVPSRRVPRAARALAYACTREHVQLQK